MSSKGSGVVGDVGKLKERLSQLSFEHFSELYRESRELEQHRQFILTPLIVRFLYDTGISVSSVDAVVTSIREVDGAREVSEVDISTYFPGIIDIVGKEPKLTDLFVKTLDAEGNALSLEDRLESAILLVSLLFYYDTDVDLDLKTFVRSKVVEISKGIEEYYSR